MSLCSAPRHHYGRTGTISCCGAGKSFPRLAQKSHSLLFHCSSLESSSPAARWEALPEHFVTPPIQKRLSFWQAIIGSLWIFVLLWLLYAIALNIILLAAITTIFFAGVTIYNNVQFSYR